MKFTFLFLNLGKIQILYLKVPRGAGGSAGLGIIPKKKVFFSASLIIIHVHWSPTCLEGDLSPASAPLLSQKSPRGKGSPGQTIIFFLLQTGAGPDMEMIVNLLGPLML